METLLIDGRGDPEAHARSMDVESASDQRGIAMVGWKRNACPTSFIILQAPSDECCAEIQMSPVPLKQTTGQIVVTRRSNPVQTLRNGNIHYTDYVPFSRPPAPMYRFY